MSVSVKHLPEAEYFVGHRACGGCGGSLVLRWVLKVLGERCYVVIPAGCMSAVSFVYPQMAIGVNAMIAPFAATPAVLSGIAAGAQAKALKNVHVVGFAGDGATADIGLQALSGAFDRRERIIYICYDNEAYMNTGIQKSSATPWGARTTTSPAGFRPRPSDPKKDLLRIAMAHGIPYAATGSVGYPSDLLKKIERASQIDGPSFLHVFAPCPTGWGCGSDTTIQLGKGAVDSGLWPLLEWNGKTLSISRKPRRFAPLADYFGLQRRFASLTSEEIAAVEASRDQRWEELHQWINATHPAPIIS